MVQYVNLLFNLSVLQCRNSQIPEAYNSIQKILQQLRSSPGVQQSTLPQSVVELLVYYNLRTHNVSSGVQLIKRRRILNVPGMMGHYHPTLNITK